MNISKKKNSYDEYSLDLSYVELMAISDALGVANDFSENPEPDAVRDSLLQGIRWYVERLPLPGEEEEKKEDKKPDDAATKAEVKDKVPKGDEPKGDELGLPAPDQADYEPLADSPDAKKQESAEKPAEDEKFKLDLPDPLVEDDSEEDTEADDSEDDNEEAEPDGEPVTEGKYVRKTRDEIEIQGHYGPYGWECVSGAADRKEALELLRDYRENEPGIRFRIRRFRVKPEPVAKVVEKKTDGLDLPDPLQEGVQEIFNHDDFLTGYAICALWSSTDTNEEGETTNFDDVSIYELPEETVLAMKEDCDQFQSVNQAALSAAYNGLGPDEDDHARLDAEHAGHDFWLSRNGHGSGFFDEDKINDRELRQMLQKAARDFGEQNLYRGDDGQIYVA